MECKKRNIILDNEKLLEEMHTYESKNTFFKNKVIFNKKNN